MKFWFHFSLYVPNNFSRYFPLACSSSSETVMVFVVYPWDLADPINRSYTGVNSGDLRVCGNGPLLTRRWQNNVVSVVGQSVTVLGRRWCSVVHPFVGLWILAAYQGKWCNQLFSFSVKASCPTIRSKSSPYQTLTLGLTFMDECLGWILIAPNSHGMMAPFMLYSTKFSSVSEVKVRIWAMILTVNCSTSALIVSVKCVH